MKREFLKGLNIEGLTDEIIDQIMAENGKDVEKQKKEIEKVNDKIKNIESELETNKQTLVDANTQIENFKGMDIDGIKRSADEWKSKYETFQTEAENQRKDFENKMKNQEYEFAAKDFINTLSFTSDFTKKAFLKEFMDQELKLNDGKFLGSDDFIKLFKEGNEGVFKEETQTDTNNEQQNQNTYIYNPQGGNQNVDLAAQIAGAIGGNI